MRTMKKFVGINNVQERDALRDQLVAAQYEKGQAINMASTLEIDAVVDPAETRAWLVRGLGFTRGAQPVSAPHVDTW